MTDEQKTSGISGNFGVIRTVLLAFALFLGVAAVLIGGLAWLIGLTGIGLSVDTRFLMATLIFCSMVGVITAILLGTAVAFRKEQFDEEEHQLEETLVASPELYEEAIANRVISKLMFSGQEDDFVGSNHAELLTQKAHRRRAKTAGRQKRK